MGTQKCINDNVVLGTLFELLKGSSHIQIWQLHNISHPSIHKIHMLGTHSIILPGIAIRHSSLFHLLAPLLQFISQCWLLQCTSDTPVELIDYACNYVNNNNKAISMQPNATWKRHWVYNSAPAISIKSYRMVFYFASMCIFLLSTKNAYSIVYISLSPGIIDW